MSDITLIKDHKLKKLPFELLKHSKTRVLEVYGKRLESIDESILEISSLEKLTLSAGPACNIPEAILGMPSLESINLKNLNLGDWGQSFNSKNASKLKKVFINSSALLNFPNFHQVCPEIEELSLMNNKIEVVPTEIYLLKNLKRLHLEGNEIKKLPEAFYEMKWLTYLGLDNNPLTEETKKKLNQSFNINF